MIVKLVVEAVGYQEMSLAAEHSNVVQQQCLASPDMEGQLPTICTVRQMIVDDGGSMKGFSPEVVIKARVMEETMNQLFNTLVM